MWLGAEVATGPSSFMYSSVVWHHYHSTCNSARGQVINQKWAVVLFQALVYFFFHNKTFVFKFQPLIKAFLSHLLWKFHERDQFVTGWGVILRWYLIQFKRICRFVHTWSITFFLGVSVSFFNILLSYSTRDYVIQTCWDSTLTHLNDEFCFYFYWH